MGKRGGKYFGPPDTNSHLSTDEKKFRSKYLSRLEQMLDVELTRNSYIDVVYMKRPGRCCRPSSCRCWRPRPELLRSRVIPITLKDTGGLVEPLLFHLIWCYSILPFTSGATWRPRQTISTRCCVFPFSFFFFSSLHVEMCSLPPNRFLLHFSTFDKEIRSPLERHLSRVYRIVFLEFLQEKKNA